MTTSTEVLVNRYSIEMCQRFGLESFEVDLFASNVARSEYATLVSTVSILGKESTQKHTSIPPVMKWVKNGIQYVTIIPITLKTVRWQGLTAGGSYDVLDWEAMEKKAVQILEDWSNGRIVPTRD